MKSKICGSRNSTATHERCDSRDAYEVLGVSRNSTANQVRFFDYCFWLWFSVLGMCFMILLVLPIYFEQDILW